VTVHLAAVVSRIGICFGLVFACMTLGAAAGHAQSDHQGLAAHSFYAIADATYRNWCRDPNDDHCPPPPRVTKFPAREQYVAFYFETNYPAQNAGDMGPALGRFGITIYTSAGTVYTRFSNLADNTQIGWQDSSSLFGAGLARIHAPQIQQDINGSVYPADTYRVDLIIDGKAAAHTTFSVGSGRPAHTAAVHPIIQAFYPATETDYSTWTDFGTIPKKITTVQGGAQVFFYLRWSNTPTDVPLSIGILDPRLHTLVAHTGLFKVTRTSGYAMFIVVEPERSAFAAGAYQGEVLLGDQVLAKTAFTIGS
jgi:hypothetical protein